MGITQVTALPAGTVVEADVCVVGAGAAGTTVATQLARSGVRVCLVESGTFDPDPDVQSLYDLQSVGYPQRPNYMSRAHYFGGSCNLWAGRSMALAPLDLEDRAWVPGGSWPLPYEELARHYPDAGKVLGLPAEAARSTADLTRYLSDDEARLLGAGDLVPTVSWWARRPRRFGSDVGHQLGSMAGVQVLLSGTATELVTSGSGEGVSILKVAALNGSTCAVRARRFVLACGGLETARLLLASRDRHPHGIGNQHDQVGRFFMDHPRAVFGKVEILPGRKLRGMRGRPTPDGKLQVGLGFSQQLQRQEQLLNHYVTLEMQSSGYTEARYQSFVQSMKVLLRRGHTGSRLDFAKRHLGQLPEMIYLLSPKEIMPHGLYRLYVAARDIVPRKPRLQTFVPVYFCEQPPTAASRVTLGEERDRLGMPRLVLDWQIDESVYRSLYRLQELLGRRLEATGLGRLHSTTDRPSFTDASHHMGTTRMSSSPADGVVDTDCRVHGMENLYVASSSVFPSAGHANPTWTIVALSLRLASHLRSLRP